MKEAVRGYRPPTVTVDTVVFSVADQRLHVLLVERRLDPFAGHLALPGVYVGDGETIHSASDRCLSTKADLSLPADAVRATVTVFDSIDRDPRGHALSVVTVALVDHLLDTSGQWVPVDEVGEVGDLPFDHVEIVAAARRWAAQVLWVSPVVFGGLLGPADPSTARIADVASAVMGTDVRVGGVSNLRRRIASCGLFAPTGASASSGGRGHPAAVWHLLGDRTAGDHRSVATQ